MRVLQLYNNYQSGGGGETRMVELIEQLLTARGHSVHTCTRDNKSIDSAGAKINAFITGIYSPSAKRDVARIIEEWTPDVVHVHNLYPLFSPSVLDACQEAKVPIVMSVHNYGLTCPSANHFRDGRTCQLCANGHEYRCLVGNCKGAMLTSAGYALRGAVARMRGQFTDRVDLFLAVSEFVKSKMVEAGYDPAKIDVLSNCVPLPRQVKQGAPGRYVAYIGAMNVQKGVETLLAAASKLPECEFVFVGDGPDRARWAGSAPRNCSFLGSMSRSDTEEIYRGARFVVVPSLWWEPFGLVVIEAMSHSRAVVAARSGALGELVTHGTDGLIFSHGDEVALAEAISTLWNDPAQAQQMGENGRKKVRQHFGEDLFADRLVASYLKVSLRTAEFPRTAVSA